MAPQKTPKARVSSPAKPSSTMIPKRKVGRPRKITLEQQQTFQTYFNEEIRYKLRDFCVRIDYPEGYYTLFYLF